MSNYDSEIYEYQLIYYRENEPCRTRHGYDNAEIAIKHGKELLDMGYIVSIREIRYIVGWRE